MPTRIRKIRRMRGSRTHGYGQIGQHRHSGQQGGHGAAGLHKHKWSWLILNDPNHYGRDPFFIPGAEKVSRWLNVGDLEDMVVTGSDGPVSVDLTALGVEKLLGSGTVKRAFNVKVGQFTERAKDKLEKSGGKILD
jgi:large subunit ribosomal protein L15